MAMQTETISFSADGTSLKGHLAFDAGSKEARPGVLVFPEWWGLNEYIRERTEQVAALGYTALGVDMYGDGKTADNPDGAGKLMNEVLGDMKTGTARVKAAHEALKKQPTVDPARVAAIGYCFGGALVLHMARIGLPLRAVVSFHGALGSFHEPKRGEVKAKVLVCHGAADKFISDDEISAFKAQMDAAGADYQFIAYKGALHGFTSVEADANGEKFGLPLGYDEAADTQSWRAMKDLLAKAL